MLVYIFIIGLAVGSFVNVIIFRLPEEKSLGGRSKCPNCDKQINWYDLVPVVSFLVLKARCRNCRGRISWLYPVVELYSGFIFVSVFKFLGQYGLASRLFNIFILECLLILALVDLRKLILPDSVMIAMFLATLSVGLGHKLGYLTANLDVLHLANFLGALVLFLFFLLLWLMSGGKWIGLGDVKLSGLVGLLFGIWGGLAVLYGAIIAGTVVGLILLLTGRAGLKTKLPLGTFISLAAAAYIFVGTNIMSRLDVIFTLIPRILK